MDIARTLADGCNLSVGVYCSNVGVVAVPSRSLVRVFDGNDCVLTDSGEVDIIVGA